MKKRAMVLFSGGQDSTTCLLWALKRFEIVETIGFDYGQRHRIELDARLVVLQAIREAFPELAKKIGADHAIDLSVLGQISQTALTSEAEIKLSENGLPNTFVPGRNILFLTLASTLAYRREIDVLVGGMCETDYSGYPDCRDDAIKALQVALNVGMATQLTLETPLMWLDKSATWELANQLGGSDFISLIVEHTHTCYVGDREHRHAWGYGCGNCPACQLRAKGYVEWKKTIVKNKGEKYEV